MLGCKRLMDNTAVPLKEIWHCDDQRKLASVDVDEAHLHACRLPCLADTLDAGLLTGRVVVQCSWSQQTGKGSRVPSVSVAYRASPGC